MQLKQAQPFEDEEEGPLVSLEAKMTSILQTWEKSVL